MGLIFPNPCRSFDADQGRVRFWGYDSAIEVSFFVESAALQRICPEMSGVESGVLEVFDGARERIHGVAEKVYERGAKGAYGYILGAEDF